MTWGVSLPWVENFINRVDHERANCSGIKLISLISILNCLSSAVRRVTITIYIHTRSGNLGSTAEDTQMNTFLKLIFRYFFFTNLSKLLIKKHLTMLSASKLSIISNPLAWVKILFIFFYINGPNILINAPKNLYFLGNDW